MSSSMAITVEDHDMTIHPNDLHSALTHRGPEIERYELGPWSAAWHGTPLNVMGPMITSPALCSIQAIQPEQITGRSKFEDIPQGYNYKTEFQHIQEPLTFHSTTGIPGICLDDALKGNFAGLADPNAKVMEVETGKKISYAFEWPTRETPVRQQMNAHRKNGVQSRGRVAQQVATVVGKFLHEQSGNIPSDPKWRVGPGYIELKHVYLLELKRISKATWVVKLALYRD